MSTGNLRDAFRAFTTSCALITTDGAQGANVMAAEWAFNVSYDPFLILVSIDPANRTHDMIRETKEFGVNLVSEDQVGAMAFAGHYSKADTDKLSSELFETVPGKKIAAPMIRGCLLNAECKLVQEVPMGDHTGFLGEVIEFTANPDLRPVVLHHGSRHLGERVARGPAVALAVTPMKAAAGATITVTGELTGPERSGVAVALTVEGDGRVSLPSDPVRTAEDGGFEVTAVLPADLPAGAYVVTARAGETQGRARFGVS